MVDQLSPIGYKKSEIGMIPENWIIKSIGEISSEIYRYPTYFNIEYVYDGEGVPEVRGELIKNNGELEENLSKYRYISLKTSRRFSKTILKPGDFIITVRGTLGKVAFINSKFNGANITANLIKISLKKELYYPEYFKQVFSNESFRNTLNKLSSQTTIKTIQSPTLKSIRFPIPPLPEQIKIAKFLSDVDALIESLDKLITKKKYIKQGLMQTLLTRGIGHTKFKKTEIGEMPENWRLSELGNLTDNESDIIAGPFGSNLKVSDYKDSGVPIIRLQNIAPNDFIPSDIKYISGTKAKELAYHSFIAGDIALAKLGDPIGISCIIPSTLKHGIVVADVVRIRVSTKKADSQFIVQFLNSSINLRQLQLEKIGTTRPRVNLSAVRKIKLFLPSLSEQQKIAQILSNADREIDVLEQKRDKYKLLKTGMMQQLLTGGIRVK